MESEKVADILDPRNGRPLSENGQQDLSWPKTVDELFGFLEAVKRQQPHQLDVSFDETFGFPARIFIDYSANPLMVDDGLLLELSNFRPQDEPRTK